MLFTINLQSGAPIYEQLYGRVAELIAQNILKADDQLPTVRMLAKDLGVNPNTVQKAYQELERDGVIYSLAGKGSFIAALDKAVPAIHRRALSAFRLAAADALRTGLTRDELRSEIEAIPG